VTGASDAAEDVRHPEVAHEPDVVPGKTSLQVFCGTISIGLLLCIVAYLALHARERGLRPSRIVPEERLPPPRAVGFIHQELFAPAHARSVSREAQNQALGRYGWVDRSRRRVSLPIDVALDLVAREHLGAKGSP
jgi:hypothetical protein